jgi:hypothetical protein
MKAASHCLAGALALCAAAAAPAEELKNWANDPFVRLSRERADCPEPQGPLMTEQDWKAEAHWRIETGTSCWLAGRCADSNAYRYDQPLAEALFPKLQAATDLLQGTSVWAFVQRRIVFLQGCVDSEVQAQGLEALARQGKDVILVVPALRVGDERRTPYRVRPPR